MTSSRPEIRNLSQQTAAELLGVDPRTLRDWNAPRNPDGTYDGPTLVNWFIQRKSELNRTEEAKERQAIARAAKLELEVSKASGDTVSRHDVDQEIMAIMIVIKGQILKIPNLVANDIPDDLRARLVSELHNGVRQILRLLANKGRELAGKIKRGEMS